MKELSEKERLVLSSLERIARRRCGRTSLTELASLTGMSRSTVRGAISELSEKGVVIHGPIRRGRGKRFLFALVK